MQRFIALILVGFVGTACSANVKTPKLSDVPQKAERSHVSSEKVVKELEEDRARIEEQRDEFLKPKAQENEAEK